MKPKNPTGVKATMPITIITQPSHFGSVAVLRIVSPMQSEKTMSPISKGKKKSLLSTLIATAAAGVRSLRPSASAKSRLVKTAPPIAMKMPPAKAAIERPSPPSWPLK